MSWLFRFLESSIGQKLIMSLTGLFLMVFLIVHLIGNLQLLADDGGEAFNTYAWFMTHNPLIKVVSYSLYAFILLHAIQGLLLWRRNRAARGDRGYQVSYSRPTESASRNMAFLGTIILLFIVFHMWQFWFQMHWGKMEWVKYAGADHEIKDLYSPVAAAFTSLYVLVFYLISMAVLAFHLWHGFWSSFQTLGLNHPKYSPLIKGLGYLYAIGIPIGFALIPLLFFIKN